MGRQMYLARMALGRGAFQEPVTDEQGNFILSANAHDVDNTDHYVQGWDARGHPQNRRSGATARELRRAKNQVLETLGIVRYKHRRAQHGLKSDDDKLQAVEEENVAGRSFYLAALAFSTGSVWWTVSLRHRVQTFHSYTRLPLIETIRSDTGILGLGTFLTAGIVGRYFSTIFSTTFRPLSPEAWTSYHNQRGLLSKELPPVTQWRWSERAYSILNMLLVIISEVPLQILASLQSIALCEPLLPFDLWFAFTHLFTKSAQPSWSYSSLQTPASSLHTLLEMALGCLSHPMSLALLYRFLQMQTEATIMLALRLTIILPANADYISRQAGRDHEELSLASRPRKQTETFTAKMLRGLERQVPFVFTCAVTVGRWLTARDIAHRRLPDGLEPSLKARMIEVYRNLVRGARRRGVILDSSQLQKYYDHALRQSFYEHGLTDNDTYLETYLEPSAWTAELPSLDEVDDASTATPDQHELFVMNDVDNTATARVEGSVDDQTDEIENTPNTALVNGHASMDGGHATGNIPPIEATSPVATEVMDEAGHTYPTMPPFDSSTAPESPSSQHQRHRRSDTPSPTPGIVRAASLQSLIALETEPASGLSPPHTPVSPRNSQIPRSRSLLDLHEALQTTDGDDASVTYSTNVRLPDDSAPLVQRPRWDESSTVDHISENNNNDPDILRSPRHDHVEQYLAETDPTISPKQHRVTLLSTLPADLFASLAAKMLTTIVLLPLESIFLRSLARNVFGNRADRADVIAGATSLINTDIRGLGEWFGRAGDGSQWRYIGSIALCIGLQGVTSSLVWAGMSILTAREGRRRGWGQF